MRKNLLPLDPGKTYLVTGAAGFIGFHLCQKLLAAGCRRVIGFDNLNDYYDVSLKKARLDELKKGKGFVFVLGDLADKKTLEEVFVKFAPDYVINLAAQAGVRYSITNPEAYINSNIIGFFNILEACRHHPVTHLVYASSSSVYGLNKKVPFSTEDKVDRPVSLYAATKKSDELMAYCYTNLYKIPSTGLRFFTVYGPFGRPDMAYFSFTEKIVKGKPIEVFNHGDMYRDFTYVDDIVEAIVRIIPNKPLPDESGNEAKVYNIGNNHTESLKHFVDVLQEILGKKALIEYKPMQPGDVYETYADVDDLVNAFGFAPKTSIEEGLKKFWLWYQSYYLKK